MLCQQCVLAAKEANSILFCIRSVQQIKGGDRAAQAWCIRSTGSRSGPPRYWRAWNISPLRKGWEKWNCLAWREESWGEASSVCINMWREGANKTGSGSFDWGTATRGHWCKLKHGRCCLNIRKHFFVVGVTEHWQFAQGGLEAAPLEIFKRHLDIFLALRNIAWAEDVGQIISRSSFQLSNYVIVWVLWS